MKMTKKDARLRRSRRARLGIRARGVDRLTVYRSACHIYAQVIRHGDPTVAGNTDVVLAQASTLDKELAAALQSKSNKAAAAEVGRLVAQRAIASGVKAVAFDRSGYKYHGRVAALADAAREQGLEF